MLHHTFFISLTSTSCLFDCSKQDAYTKKKTNLQEIKEKSRCLQDIWNFDIIDGNLDRAKGDESFKTMAVLRDLLEINGIDNEKSSNRLIPTAQTKRVKANITQCNLEK